MISTRTRKPAKTQPKTLPHVQSITGPTMKNILTDSGIPAQQVTYKRESGCYVAEFYEPKMQEPVAAAAAWAERIAERVKNSHIIDQHDTVATWRAGQPVIWASVTFKIR